MTRVLQLLCISVLFRPCQVVLSSFHSKNIPDGTRPRRAVQDQPPYFLNAPYKSCLSEDSPQGTTSVTGSFYYGVVRNPQKIRLEIECEGNANFRSHLRPGKNHIGRFNILTGATRIDRKNESILQQGGHDKCFLKLFDDDLPMNATATLDVNSKGPVFDKTNYSAVVPKGLKAGSAIPKLEISVTDCAADAQFELSLTSPKNAEGIFELQPTSATSRTQVHIKVVDESKLDYENLENREMVFVLRASDGIHRPSIATVILKLADVNDNKPVFPDSSFRFCIAQDTPPGTLITRLEATDADNGTFGQVRYELHGLGADKFLLNETTGDLFVGDCGFDICLDYKAQKSYTFAYHAIDGGGLSTAVQLIIDVKDVNDNASLSEVPESRRVIPNGATGIYPPTVVTVKPTDSGIPPLSPKSNGNIPTGNADSKDAPKSTPQGQKNSNPSIVPPKLIIFSIAVGCVLFGKIVFSN